jgi:hypothetical protein
MGCPERDVVVEPWTEWDQPVKATGCGKTDYVIMPCRSEGNATSVCELLTFSEAASQAAFAANCPVERVTTQWLGKTLGVEACGQRLVYVPTVDGWAANVAGAGTGSE